jgi:D-erythronate 2-dehydrogenase
MHILITGGAGFLGQRLAQQLLSLPTLKSLTLADIVTPAIPTRRAADQLCVNQPSVNQSSVNQPQILTQQVDLSDRQAVQNLVTPELNVIYHLAAVVSGQAEADFDLGMAVNGEGTRYLLEAVRHQAPGAMFIFASSLAVFGGDLPAVITDTTAVTPQSSYGTQKAVAELWINDYSRKGFINGRVLRLPTVCVRPGLPNAAASSFASSIIREPLQGLPAICPVNLDLPLWLCSPETVVNNLMHALTLSSASFSANRTANRTASRIVNLPGLSVTVQHMIDSLARVAGSQTIKHIQHQPDEAVSKIVASWPSQFDTSRAQALGFAQDSSFEEIIHAFIARSPV